MTLNYPALLLNADYTPVKTYPLSIWNFERTLKNVVNDKIDVVETYDVVLRSQNSVYRPPSVVALRNYVRMPDKVPFTRMNVFLRDEFKCQYCTKEFSPRDLTFDHVIPRASGGKTNWQNIATACAECNSKKGDRKLLTPIRPPFEPTGRVLARARVKPKENLHKSWLDYLYWSGVLEKDD